MKHLAFLLLSAAACSAQAQNASPAAKAEYTSYGDAITPEGAISVAEFGKAAAKLDSMQTKIRTEIQSSCAKKGCWMDVKLVDGTSMKSTSVNASSACRRNAARRYWPLKVSTAS